MVKRVGRYEIHRTLGEGTFGKVKLAINTDTNDQVAIKILDKEKIQRQNMGAQIKKEISIMKMIRHRNVVQLREVLASRTKIFIVLELVTGGELFDKIVSMGKLTEDVARYYFRQLIDGVEYCHARGVCHRDLKPENLLLDSAGNLKISDFGLSALYQNANQDEQGTSRVELLHTTCGTPNYVAPEVLADQGYDGRKADIWSCGVILYVLLSGFLPFDESTMAALFRKIQAAEFSYPVWFSSEVRSLIDGILVSNPTKRATLMDVKQHVWYIRGEETDVNCSSFVSQVAASGGAMALTGPDDDDDDDDDGGAEDVGSKRSNIGAGDSKRSTAAASSNIQVNSSASDDRAAKAAAASSSKNVPPEVTASSSSRISGGDAVAPKRNSDFNQIKVNQSSQSTTTASDSSYYSTASATSFKSQPSSPLPSSTASLPLVSSMLAAAKDQSVSRQSTGNSNSPLIAPNKLLHVEPTEEQVDAAVQETAEEVGMEAGEEEEDDDDEDYYNARLDYSNSIIVKTIITKNPLSTTDSPTTTLPSALIASAAPKRDSHKDLHHRGSGSSLVGGRKLRRLNALDVIDLCGGFAVDRLFVSERDVKRVFHFMSQEEPDEILSQLATALRELGCVIHIFDDVFKIKASLQTSKGQIGVVFLMYSLVDTSVQLVEIRRGKGDILEFHSFYHRLYAKIIHLISAHEKSSTI